MPTSALRFRRFVLPLVLGFLLSLFAQAQEDPRVAAPGAFGGQDQDLWIAATQFSGKVFSSSNLVYSGSHFYSNTSSATPQRFYTQIPLPSGAQITNIECHVRDTSAVNDVDLTYQRWGFNVATNAPAVGFIRTWSTGGAPGYQDIVLPVSALDGAIRHSEGDIRWLYYLSADVANDTEFRGCRIEWHRTVSPAPAVATYPIDTPVTHPYFPFIEALARAGVTGGCGVGVYCPDSPITRGQMAVFLAVALGLHSPN